MARKSLGRRYFEESMKFSLKTLPVTKILLDPNNQRFLDSPSWRRRQERRFHDPMVQEATLRLLEREPRYALGELIVSILANGYIPMERIIVVPHRFADGLYLVVEGNRRVAVLKSILRDHDEGVITLSTSQITNLSRIPVAVLEESGEALTRAERVIMGIRHIAGPRPWGAYQRAQFILEMFEQEGQDFEAIAKHLGMSKIETSRRYRAIKALKAMQEDEMYASVATPDFYNLFHELVANRDVREFFSWNHELAKFENQERHANFSS